MGFDLLCLDDYDMLNGYVKWNIKKCKLEINIKIGVVSFLNGSG